MTDKEVMQMALDALESALSDDKPYISSSKEAIEALRAALAQPEPEPVAWADAFDIGREGHDFWVSRQKPARDGVPLYTIPKREWVKLTDKEIDAYSPTDIVKHRVAFARVIEAKLKEKNSG